MSSLDTLKTLFETEADPNPFAVGRALAEYCHERGTADDDRQVVALLSEKGFRSAFSYAVHFDVPLKGKTSREKLQSMTIALALKYLQISVPVPESLVLHLEAGPSPNRQ